MVQLWIVDIQTRMIKIAIVGDYNAGYQSHSATSDAVDHSSTALGLAVDHRWIGTDDLARPEGATRLAEFGGFWIAPGSPYKSMSGALSAIRMARERQIPLLGTCGGFQHIPKARIQSYELFQFKSNAEL